MRVFHIYPQGDPVIFRYVGILQDSADTETEATDDAKAMLERCKVQRPDIIHMHGCQDAAVIKAVWGAYQQGMRIILTPHGQLSSWDKPIRQQIHPLLRRLVGHCYVLIARSPMEVKELEALGWNARIETVKNSLLTRTTSAEAMQDSYRHIYQKVMDSNVLEFMNDETRQALRSLIKIGIIGDERWGDTFNPAHVQWRLLNIYARQEGIISYVERGLLAKHMTIPMPDAIENYLPDHYMEPADMTGKPLTEQVRKLYNQCREGHLSLLSLVALHQALRSDDVEDDLLMQQLETDHLSGFMAELMPVMREQTGLDEGFMPCHPQEGQDTQRLRTIIKENLSI